MKWRPWKFTAAAGGVLLLSVVSYLGLVAYLKYAVLNVEVGPIYVTDERLIDLFDLPTFERRSIVLNDFFQSVVGKSSLVALRVNLNVQRIRLRDLLNQICAQHPGLYWTAISTKHGEIYIRFNLRALSDAEKAALPPPTALAISKRDFETAKHEEYIEYVKRLGTSLEDVAKPEWKLKYNFLTIVKDILLENPHELVMLYTHPLGVRVGPFRFSVYELIRTYQRLFRENDYRQFKLSDVIELDTIDVQQIAEGRFRVSAPTKFQYVDERMYFDDRLSFVFEDYNGRYVVVELD